MLWARSGELREQLAQERKWLDWALSHDAMYYKGGKATGVLLHVRL